jgi:predicted outer membrane protein
MICPYFYFIDSVRGPCFLAANEFNPTRQRSDKNMFQKLITLMIGVILIFALSTCSQTSSVTDVPAATETPTTAMDHSDGEMEHTMDGGSSTAPFDAQFIDSMIEHHQGAITMAKQALEESERPEIKQLSEAIIAAQQKEIEQMKA